MIPNGPRLKVKLAYKYLSGTEVGNLFTAKGHWIVITSFTGHTQKLNCHICSNHSFPRVC